jgi:hypothetical protein
MGEPERFYVRSKPTIIDGFRRLRAVFEKIVEARGEKLEPEWYDDGPERCPELYKDQPELLNSAPTEGESQ